MLWSCSIPLAALCYQAFDVPTADPMSLVLVRGQAVVEYGSSWCAHCQEMFPHFYRLSAQVRALLQLLSHGCSERDSLQSILAPPWPECLAAAAQTCS